MPRRRPCRLHPLLLLETGQGPLPARQFRFSCRLRSSEPHWLPQFARRLRRPTHRPARRTKKVLPPRLAPLSGLARDHDRKEVLAENAVRSLPLAPPHPLRAFRSRLHTVHVPRPSQKRPWPLLSPQGLAAPRQTCPLPRSDRPKSVARPRPLLPIRCPRFLLHPDWLLVARQPLWHRRPVWLPPRLRRPRNSKHS
jgi:hypothetical protein